MAGIFGIGTSGTGIEQGRDDGEDVLLSWKAHQVIFGLASERLI